MMTRMLSTRRSGGSLDSDQKELVKSRKGMVTAYLTTALAPGLASEGKSLGVRNEREMRTLPEALDALLVGDICYIRP